MIVLSCSNLTKSYIVDKVLDNINFAIKSNEKVGLVGSNGAGKSTLFNILIGQLSPDSGEIFLSKDTKLGYLEQQTGINSENTMYEELLEVFDPLFEMEDRIRNLEKEISREGEKPHSNTLENLMNQYAVLLEEFESLNGYGFKSEISGVLKGLGFNEDQFDISISKLSGGQKARVALAKVLLEKPDILLLDEPTNHLDIEAIDWLEGYIKGYEGAAIVISHDRYFLDNTISKTFLLESANLHIYNGNYSLFMKRRKEELLLLEKRYEEQQKEINKQEEIIRRFKGHGTEKFAKRALSREKMLDRMDIIEREVVDSRKTQITFEPQVSSGTDVISVSNLGKSFDDNKLFENVSFNIYKGERVGLIGPNGIGKTTLFKIITQELAASSGEVNLGHQVNLGYFDQEQSDLNDNKTVADEIWDEHPTFEHQKIRDLLARFLFFGDDIFKEISSLSGGEKSRIALLKLMLSHANFLLMDEPTNHLDIDSKEVLEDALLNYEGTLFVISHDRYFLNKVTDKILDISKTGVTEYLGNYDYYIEKKNALLANVEVEDDPITRTQAKTDRRKTRDKERQERKTKKHIKSLEQSISKYEKEISCLEEKMCLPEIYSDYNKSNVVNQEILSLKDELDNIYLEWMELTD